MQGHIPSGEQISIRHIKAEIPERSYIINLMDFLALLSPGGEFHEFPEKYRDEDLGVFQRGIYGTLDSREGGHPPLELWHSSFHLLSFFLGGTFFICSLGFSFNPSPR
jgi:hypothetical protein